MTWLALGGFALAVLPFVLTPGASLALTTQWTLQERRWAVTSAACGTATGIVVHAALAAAGLSAVVMNSSRLFLAVKLAGAGYLVGLGAWTLWQTRRRPAGAGRTARRLPWARLPAYWQAVLANVLNPKAAAVYLTVAPQFLAHGRLPLLPLLAMAGVHAVANSLWLGAWGAALRRGRRSTAGEGFRVVVGRVGGSVLIALGVRTAAAAR